MVKFLLTLGLVLISSSHLSAQTDFYQGKQVKVVVGFTTGGFCDRWAKLLARYMPKYIPGNPSFVVQNMPGAGSVVATNYLYSVAKPDGLTIAPENNRRVAQVILAAESFGRPIISGPGLPADRVTTLRRAFDQAMKDPDLLAETQKQKMDVDPENGENLEKLAQQILLQPAEVLARVKKILSN